VIQTEFLIIGQGISGTWLSYWLEKAGKDFLIIDDADPSSSSRVAAGIINPVTGRRYATTWMSDTLLPFVEQAYGQVAREFSLQTISKKYILDFFPSTQMRLAFMERQEETDHLEILENEGEYRTHLNFDLGLGRIQPVYTVHLQEVLKHWRKKLGEKISGESFNADLVRFEGEKIFYKEIETGNLVLCDGVNGMHHQWFKDLPFAPNKGEALIVEIPDLPTEAIYKKGMMIVPLPQTGLFWVGASYQWEYQDPNPSQEFRERTEAFLRSFLKLPFSIVDHLSSIRPASLERRPFVGMHPKFPRLGILNGMGTKGCSLAPYFAKQLSDHLIHGTSIEPLADIKRFTRILSK
jgi:glycine/D-amino acid oxidase-like deaminating enzyme